MPKNLLAILSVLNTSLIMIPPPPSILARKDIPNCKGEENNKDDNSEDLKISGVKQK